MFRLMHLGTEVGFNMVKNAVGLPCKDPAEIMARMDGSVYQKAAQGDLKDPRSAVYSECVPWDEPKLLERLQWYCAEQGLDPESFTFVASGSVGGVFRGPVRADGAEWVVKIQYAGIKEQFEDDMQAIGTAGSLLLSTGRQTMLHQTRDLFLGEFDYEQERANLERVRAIWELEDTVQIPEVFAPACAEGVLAMSYMTGTPMHRHVGPEPLPLPAGVEMDTIGERIVDFVLGTWSHGLVFADPHWGNFLVGSDGTLQVVDFGTVYTTPAEDDSQLTLQDVCDFVQAAGDRTAFGAALSAHPVSGYMDDMDRACADFFDTYSFFHDIMDGEIHHFDPALYSRVQDLLDVDIKSYMTPCFTAITRALLMTVGMLCYMDVDVNMGMRSRRYTTGPTHMDVEDNSDQGS
jgi:predicted unusual protein kinase regulating ubiquinone biosynthesis (AarF/ABC1/UbiB family)